MVIQRVREARVEVEGQVTGEIGLGLLVLLAVGKSDCQKDADYLVEKLVQLRIFPDATGKMNLNIREAGGSLLLVSQFTLYGDCRRGRRPSFDLAADAPTAAKLYDYFAACARRAGVRVETGVFQAFMQVTLVNDGPVTLICESPLLTSG
jgi:D-tyrosyl-tRNA(Tyr) deacylase